MLLFDNNFSYWKRRQKKNSSIVHSIFKIRFALNTTALIIQIAGGIKNKAEKELGLGHLNVFSSAASSSPTERI